MELSSSSSDSDSELEEIAEAAFSEAKLKLNKRNILNCNSENKSSVCQESEGTSVSFMIDNKPGSTCTATSSSSANKPPTFTYTDVTNSNEKLQSSGVSDEEEDDQVNRKDTDDKKTDAKQTRTGLASSIEVSPDLSDLYIEVNAFTKKGENNITSSNKILSKLNIDNEVMKKSVITPDIERKYIIPPYEEGLRQKKKQRKLEREKTKGKGWFGLPATELDEEKKNDLLALKMRRALNPKRFYKANDIKGLPKYYQFGTVIEGPAEFYSARIPKKQRKQTIVEELLADAEFRKYNKRKYTEIQEAKRRGIGPYQHIKRGKKKKKKT